MSVPRSYYPADIEPDLNGTAVLAQRLNWMHVQMVALEELIDQVIVRLDTERRERERLEERLHDHETIAMNLALVELLGEEAPQL